MRPDESGSVDEASVDDSASLDVGLPSDLYSIFERERTAQLAAYRRYVGSPRYVDHLQQAVQSLMGKEPFKRGTIVQWKTFLKGAQFPEYGSPAIVVDVLDNPRTIDSDGDPIPSPVDIFIGYLDGDQDLQLVATDSRRLTEWDAKA